MNNHILPFKLTDDILNGTPTWYETQKQGSYIQIGEGKILLEDASATATIVNSYAKNDATSQPDFITGVDDLVRIG
ncbi:MAG: hypothetical protein V8S95_10360 [Odoribacter sp.]